MNETLVVGPLLVLGFVLLVFTAAMCAVLLVGWLMCRTVDRYTIRHRCVMGEDRVDTTNQDD